MNGITGMLLTALITTETGRNVAIKGGKVALKLGEKYLKSAYNIDMKELLSDDEANEEKKEGN